MARIRLPPERICDLTPLAVRDRLHCELLRLCLAAGISDNRAVIEDAPTHSQIAARISTHREAVTRELQQLTRKAIVAQQRRRLAVNDVAALAEIVRTVAGDVEIIQQVARESERGKSGIPVGDVTNPTDKASAGADNAANRRAAYVAPPGATRKEIAEARVGNE